MTDTVWAKQTIKLQEKPNLHLMLHVILITSPDDCGWSGGGVIQFISPPVYKKINIYINFRNPEKASIYLSKNCFLTHVIDFFLKDTLITLDSMPIVKQAVSQFGRKRSVGYQSHIWRKKQGCSYFVQKCKLIHIHMF